MSPHSQLWRAIVRKRPLGTDVLTAATDRIAAVFDRFDRVSVSFSGGKDSTVMLHLVAPEARRRQRRIGVLFVDLEAQYGATIEHVAACLDYWSDVVDPYWIALPLSLRNAVSQYEPQWICWDPDKPAGWVRQPPADAITDPSRWDWFRVGMEFEELVPAFGDWYAGGVPTACFVGIRCQESLNRWRTIASRTKRRANGWQWATWKSDTVVNVYPLYDWTTEDVWTWHARQPDAPCNRIYDLMHRAGLTIHQARICQPYGDDQRRGLWLYHALEPDTWAKVVARVNGANQGALYARERGNILGNHKVTRPAELTWQQFAELMLDSMPAATAEHYRTKIDVFLRWWACRGFERGIPDEADPQAEAARETPSWRRICKALLRNDYWCKGLSFSQHKSTASHARYQAIMARRRNAYGGGSPHDRWEAECRAGGADLPGRPTSKQLALIAALTGGSTPHQAWKALGKHLGCSATSARKRSTRSDASALIAALRDSDAAFRAERYQLAEAASQGQAAITLAGEGHGN